MRARLMGAVGLLLAIALGVALGTGPLQGDTDRAADDAAKYRAALSERDATIGALTAAAELSSAYIGKTAARVVAGRLTGRRVALILLPGTDSNVADLVGGLVRAAGAQVTAQVELTDEALDRANQGLVEALTSQMIQETDGLVAPNGATGSERLGLLLSRAVGVPRSAGAVGAPYDPAAISVLSGLSAAGLVRSSDVTARAALAVILVPGILNPEKVAVLTSIVAGFAAQIPSVVTGPADAAAGKNALAILRAASLPLSTVDSVDSSAGRVTTVLALAAQARGVRGNFGAIGPVDAAIPPDQ